MTSLSSSIARVNVASTSSYFATERRTDDVPRRVGERRRRRTRECNIVTRATHNLNLDDASLIYAAKQRAEETTKKYAKSFYLASLLMTSGRDVAYALYSWCRELDELVDGTASSSSADETERALDGVLDRLQQIFRRQIPENCTYADLAMFDAVPQLKVVGIKPFADMVEGMRMDVKRQQFQTFADVELYAYRVAGTVALMILPILTVGVVEDTVEDTKSLREERGVALGMALQMTNICRDVGEDRRRDPSRVYLAAEDLRLFGLTHADVVAMKEPTFSYKAAVELQIQRALAYYRIAKSGLRLLPNLSKPATNAIMGLYKKILLSIRDNDYDNLNKRAFATKASKIFALPSLIWNAFSESDSHSIDEECDLYFRFDDVSDRERQATICELLVAIRVADDELIASSIEALSRRQKTDVQSEISAKWKLWYNLGRSTALDDTYIDETIKIVPSSGNCAIYRRKT